MPLQKLPVNIPLPADDAAKSQLAARRARSARAGLAGRHRVPPADARRPGQSGDRLFRQGRRSSSSRSRTTTPAQRQKITVPCEYVGQFYPQRDIDWVQFDAKKGEIYWIEVDLAPARPRQRSVLRPVPRDEERQGRGAASPTSPRSTTRRSAAARIGTDFDAIERRSVVQVRRAARTARIACCVRDQFGDGRKDPSYRLSPGDSPSRSPISACWPYPDRRRRRSNSRTRRRWPRRSRPQGRHDADRRCRSSAATSSTARSR